MFVAPAYVTINPSFTMPEVILQYNQVSGAFETLAGGKVQTRIGEGDLAVYVKKLNVRTKVAAGNQAYESLPSADIVASYASTATYLLRARAEWNHHDANAAGNWGVSIDQAQRLAMRQGIFQQQRNALLYGITPSNGEGLLNAAGATTTSLPADSNGNATISTYDNGQLAFYLLQQLSALKTRTMQIGMANRVVILAPQRVFAQMNYQGIVQLTQFQRVGGGVMSTAGVIAEIAKMNGDEVDFVCDDTLIAQGAGGTDAIIMIIPEIKKPMGSESSPNTGEFQKLMPGLDACAIMLQDMAAPREIRSPLPGGAIDVLSELRTTSGWPLRPEALTIISAGY